MTNFGLRKQCVYTEEELLGFTREALSRGIRIKGFQPEALLFDWDNHKYELRKFYPWEWVDTSKKEHKSNVQT